MNHDNINRQLADVNNSLDTLNQFADGLQDIVDGLKLADEVEVTRLIEATFEVSAKTGIHAPTMVEASLREKLAIMSVAANVAMNLNNLSAGIMHWDDFAEENAELKALARPQSFEGKLRQRFEHLPCFKHTKAFYDRCQQLTDNLIHAQVMAARDGYNTSIH